MTSTRRSATVRDVLLPLVPVVAAAVVYVWLPFTYFFGDDFLHLYEAVNLSPLVFALQPHGGHIYVVRNLVLDATLALAGARAEWFMATVLVTHLLNVWLLFRVIRRFTSSALLACLGALAWGTAPDAARTLGWYSVYGQALATTAMLTVLAWAGRYTEAERSPSARTVLGWVVLAVLGATCFGTGVAFGVALPVVLGLLVPAVWRDRSLRTVLFAAPITVVAIYALVPVVYAWLDPQHIGSGSLRFVVAALLKKGLTFLVDALGLLVGRGVTGLVALREGPVHGIRVALLAWLVGCALALWRGTTTERRYLLAFIVATGAAYGSVLIGRGFAGTVTTVPRYQYYAQATLVVTVCLVAARLRGVRAATPGVELLGGILAAGLLVALRGSSDAMKPELRSGERMQVRYFEHSIRKLAMSRADGDVLYVANAPRGGNPVPIPHARLPGYAALFCTLHPDGTMDGRRVRFVDPHLKALAVAAEGRCSASVLIGAPPAGATVVTFPLPPPIGTPTDGHPG